MASTSEEARRRQEAFSRDLLVRHQLARLNELLATILPANRFYAAKLAGLELPLESVAQVFEIPLTTKSELVRSDEQEFAANLTFPLGEYVRLHRTSGTHGRPLIIVDTEDDWRWWINTWQFVLDAAEVTTDDRALMAFSFGPFVGFWSAYDALACRGAMVIPAGGLDSSARLELIESTQSTILCCTPSYALRLAEVAGEKGVDVARSSVSRVVVAGEPGGSIPSIRRRIEQAWGARVVDHSGATEVGPWGYGAADGRGLHVVESEFLAEFIELEHQRPAKPGELSELVLTTLGRHGCPVIRYRTGDLVRPNWNSTRPNQFVLLEGGVLGRVDDMLVIRGVNVFPSSVEQILRSFPEVDEYRMTAHRQGALDELSIQVEDRANEPARIEQELRLRLGLRIEVTVVSPGSLPRYEGKGRRFVDLRRND